MALSSEQKVSQAIANRVSTFIYTECLYQL